MPEPPKCVGTIEPDHPTCNGDPKGLTEQDRLPCAWRNRCAGLQHFCEETGQVPEIVVATLDYDRLVQLCETRIEMHEITDGTPGGKETQRPVRKKPKGVKTRSKVALSEELLSLGAHFERCLKDEFPNQRFATDGRLRAKLGTFYPVDRTRDSRYLSWYCTTDSGPDRAIACLLGCVDIALPVEIEVLQELLDEKTFQRFAPVIFELGQFQSLLKHLDREAVGLGGYHPTLGSTGADRGLMIRVVVIGLKLEGLLAGWVLRQHPHLDVTLVGDPPIGGLASERESVSSFDHTPGLGGVLNALRINYSSYQPRTGILLRDRIEKYPSCFGGMCPDEVERVWCDIRAKARLEPKKPNGELKRRRVKRNLRLDEDELLQSLTSGLDRLICNEAWCVEPGAVFVGNRRLACDYVVITEPLWRYRSRVWFNVPTMELPKRTIAKLIPRKPQRYRRWDQVLTPYTANDAVHQINESGDGYIAVVDGEAESSTLLGDLNFLFPDGYDLVRLQSDEHGAIMKPSTKMRWPENVAALGTYAEWRQGAGLDAVIDGAYDLMRRWTKGGC